MAQIEECPENSRTIKRWYEAGYERRIVAKVLLDNTIRVELHVWHNSETVGPGAAIRCPWHWEAAWIDPNDPARCIVVSNKEELDAAVLVCTERVRTISANQQADYARAAQQNQQQKDSLAYLDSMLS